MRSRSKALETKRERQGERRRSSNTNTHSTRATHHLSARSAIFDGCDLHHQCHEQRKKGIFAPPLHFSLTPPPPSLLLLSLFPLFSYTRPLDAKSYRQRSLERGKISRESRQKRFFFFSSSSPSSSFLFPLRSHSINPCHSRKIE